jgi:FkbM family methyltransferase
MMQAPAVPEWQYGDGGRNMPRPRSAVQGQQRCHAKIQPWPDEFGRIWINLGDLQRQSCFPSVPTEAALMSDSPPPLRKIALVLASTDHGTMIVNRFDYHTPSDGQGYGVGFKLLNESSHEFGEITVAAFILDSRRRLFGDGVTVVDCGANIGTHTISWARQMTGWGSVIAIEAQEKIYYALAGNIAINNCFNARAIHAAAGDKNGAMKIPSPDYFAPASFGSLELKPAKRAEQIGQTIDYADANLVPVDAITIDSLALDRLDLLKIDVEGMELEVLEGAKRIIRRSLPVIIIEHIKTGPEEIVTFLKHYGYHMAELGLNVLAIHPSDKTSEAFTRQSMFRRQ